MTPGARSQAAIELLDAILAAARDGGAAADTLIARYFATRRYAGAKDRRAVRDLVYRAIRDAGERPATGRSALVALADRDEALAATFDGGRHAPARIAADERRAAQGIAPGWLIAALAASGIDGADRAALVDRAPLDLRVNTLRATRDEVAARVGGDALPGLPDALRLPAGTDVAALGGLVEVQDAGSQAVTMAVAARPGQAIVDLCAGAGGKTLALAAAMGDRGTILATDTDRARLSRLPPRAAAAGVTIVTTRLLDPGGEAAALADWAGHADAVLVDAPCSGTGTWRRNPEARWRLSPARLDRFVAMQARVLDLAVPLVRPGGAIVYVVCSLLDQEGQRQVDAFLARHRGWTIDPPTVPLGSAHGGGLRLTPASDGTDGFFVARVRAPC